MTLSELVTDWGGFELLIAELNKTGDVTVEHNVVLPGRSGAPRQIDVLIRHKQGLYEHLVVAECKFWNAPVDRATVDSLATTIREVGASRGVIFSSKGFQSGAITQATAENIDLFRVRDLTDTEWGGPGKIVDFFLHVISVAIGPFQMHDILTLPGAEPKSANVNLCLGGDEKSKTPITWPGRQFKTLEEAIENAARDAAKQVYKAVTFKHEDSFNLVLRTRITVNFAPPQPIVAHVNEGVILIPRATLEIGLTTNQSRLIIDRSRNHVFALAVEDCVKNCVTAASRRVDSATTSLSPLTTVAENPDNPSLKNGSILCVWVGGFENFDAFAKIKPGSSKIELAPPPPEGSNP
ncbi:restriction endonuclease [Paraburkholderia tropica]|uniref:Restriction endonuclease n=1 Tax=Paraburkholderia tropica TaxID=92647 RepID=A0ABX5MLL1_9BURK|nr:restriction endonuclease [Paraburkholderia tropica]PXX14549.1 restriction endonuclease [Paraburkholderia tropica]PZW79614.1 restriction endonuclease [Paraburkholderia tropica]